MRFKTAPVVTDGDFDPVVYLHQADRDFVRPGRLDRFEQQFTHASEQQLLDILVHLADANGNLEFRSQTVPLLNLVRKKSGQSRNQPEFAQGG
jgi:hypothetical protein